MYTFLRALFFHAKTNNDGWTWEASYKNCVGIWQHMLQSTLVSSHCMCGELRGHLSPSLSVGRITPKLVCGFI